MVLWMRDVYGVQDNGGEYSVVDHSGTDRDSSSWKLQNWSALTIAAVTTASLPPECKLGSQFSKTSCLGTTLNEIIWHVSGVAMAGLSTG